MISEVYIRDRLFRIPVFGNYIIDLDGYKHNVKAYDSIYKTSDRANVVNVNDSPFIYVNGNRFVSVQEGSVLFDLRDSLVFHFGDGSFHGYKNHYSDVTSKAFTSFISYAKKELNPVWTDIVKNWNYVSYIALTEESFRYFKNNATPKLFPVSVLENVKRDGCCILAFMLTHPANNNIYVIDYIESIVKGLHLSDLLYYYFLQHNVDLVPGFIVPSAASYWQRFIHINNRYELLCLQEQYRNLTNEEIDWEFL